MGISIHFIQIGQRLINELLAKTIQVEHGLSGLLDANDRVAVVIDWIGFELVADIIDGDEGYSDHLLELHYSLQRMNGAVEALWFHGWRGGKETQVQI